MAKSKNNTLLWIAAAAGAAVLLTKNVKSSIVSILTSIKRTFYNEGTWQPESAPRQKDDIGNYYPYYGENRIYYGTNYGITAQFLVDNYQRLGIPITDRNVVKNLTAQDAEEIYQTVIGAQMRYDEYKNQFIADFIFDWMVQRPATCKEYMTRDIFGWTTAERKAEINKGQFSDRLINSINGSDPAALYNSLKFWRLYHLTYTETYRSFRKGVYNRIVRYDDFPRTPEVQDMINKAYNKAFGASVVSRTTLVKPKVITIA
jgi:hypothetical protein